MANTGVVFKVWECMSSDCKMSCTLITLAGVSPSYCPLECEGSRWMPCTLSINTSDEAAEKADQ
jgi:hypothetical protein